MLIPCVYNVALLYYVKPFLVYIYLIHVHYTQQNKAKQIM